MEKSMTVTWVIERDVFSDRCFDEMVKHFETSGIPYHVVKIIPFIHEIDGKVPDIKGPVVCYGSIGIQNISKKYDWKPGIWTTDLFNEKVVQEKLGDLYLNYDAMIVPFMNVLDHCDYEDFFIKPNTDSKEFAGLIMNRNEFIKWRDNLISIGYLDNKDFDVVVSSSKLIGVEYRLVVVKNQIVSWSRYGSKTVNKNLPGNALKTAMLATMKFQPTDVYVMDIVDTPAGWKVVEYNTFNSAGLYDCNVGKIIDSINKFVEKNNG